MSGKEVTIVVDGREIAATEGQMLHDAAREGDVEIPVFCYDPKLGDPVGAMARKFRDEFEAVIAAAQSEAVAA